MSLSRAALAAFFALALAVSAEAKREPRKPATAQPRVDCKTLSDSLIRLYDRSDPTYLTWDFTEAGCDSSQLYLAYYYQGIGFLFLSAWKEALFFLNAARKIGGPKDEEILYHLWTVYRKLERYPEMERLTLEMHQRYPSSLFLLEILDQWKAIKPPAHIAWNYTSRAAVASNDYLNNQLANRIQGEMRQQAGKHRFRERASASLVSKPGERLVHGFQANLGGEYAVNGVTAEANWGAGYETRAQTSTLLLTNGPQSILIDSNWNFAQGRAAIGYSFTTPGGWNLTANASAFQLNRDWRAISLSHSQSFLFPGFILMGYVDLQRHWIKAPKDTFTLNDPTVGQVTETIGLDGMYTFTATVTPYFSFGPHAFGIGPAYYLARSHSSGEFLGAPVNETDWEHSFALTASYDYDLRRWCRLGLTGSYGADVSKRSGASKYSSTPVYSADAGITFSF